MRNRKIIVFVLMIACLPATGQQKYWIYFKDKNCLQDCRDQPINEKNIEHIQELNIHIIAQSNWLNAVSVVLDTHQANALGHLPFIKKISPVNNKIKIATFQYDTNGYGKALAQINAKAFAAAGLSGKGIKIGVIDGGFLRADKQKYLKHLIDNNQIKAYRNFIERDIKDPFGGSFINNDDHGSEVLTYITGANNGRVKGLATHAGFYLARTDQSNREYRGEEDYWVEALEWMYEQGVRLVNSSVGYSTGYDIENENYTPTMVDGESSAITQAANIAAREKNMLIVISAGNDGNNNFRVISVPADAEGVITVGATDYEHWQKAGYSSVGPETLGYIKPEVSCFAAGGTSFSAPVITGVAACIMEADSTLTSAEVKEVIIKSSHLYRVPNDYIGYGVPDAEKILNLIRGKPPYDQINHIKTTACKLNIQLTGKDVVVFHKTDSVHVRYQKREKTNNNKLTIIRPEGITHSTVSGKGIVYEVQWLKE